MTQRCLVFCWWEYTPFFHRRNRSQNSSGKQEEEDVVSPSQVTGESDEDELSFGQRQLQLHPFPTFYFFFFSAQYNSIVYLLQQGIQLDQA